MDYEPAWGLRDHVAAAWSVHMQRSAANPTQKQPTFQAVAQSPYISLAPTTMRENAVTVAGTAMGRESSLQRSLICSARKLSSDG